LKLAIALRERASTGFWPAIWAMSRWMSAIWFLSASASMPVLIAIFTRRGTWCRFL
jgi:hypothetical protein